MVGQIGQQQDDLAVGAPVCPERRQDQRNERIQLPIALGEAAEAAGEGLRCASSTL